MGSLAVITGANKGIGLVLARHLRNKGYSVVASCRTASHELDNIGKVVEGVDVRDPAGVNRLREAVGDAQVNLLFCNAGLIEAEEGGSLDDMVRAIPAIREEFETNAMGPLRTVHALNSNLKPGASKVIVIGSSTGSVAKAQSGSFMPGTLGYSCTKAAEHMVAVHMSKALAERNIPLGIVHPGTVLTDNALEYHHQDEQLVKEKATDTDESVDAIIDIAEHKVNIENTGTFWDARGKEPRPF